MAIAHTPALIPILEQMVAKIPTGITKPTQTYASILGSANVNLTDMVTARYKSNGGGGEENREE